MDQLLVTDRIRFGERILQIVAVRRLTKRIPAGILQWRITIERAISTKDAYGTTINNWMPLRDTWACIEPISGREPIVTNRPQGELTHVLKMRSDDVMYSSMELDCREVVRNG